MGHTTEDETARALEFNVAAGGLQKGGCQCVKCRQTACLPSRAEVQSLHVAGAKGKGQEPKVSWPLAHILWSDGLLVGISAQPRELCVLLAFLRVSLPYEILIVLVIFANNFGALLKRKAGIKIC